MKWICVCLTENDDSQNNCQSCKKERPVYKKVKPGDDRLEFDLNSKINYYLTISEQYIRDATESIESMKKIDDKQREASYQESSTAIKSLNMVLKIFETIDKEINNSEKIPCQETRDKFTAAKYLYYFTRGKFFFESGDYEKSIINSELARSLEITQESTFLLVAAIRRIPVEDIPGFRKGDRLTIAIEQKHAIEKNLLLSIIRMDPTTTYAKTTGITLLENYSVEMF